MKNRDPDEMFRRAVTIPAGEHGSSPAAKMGVAKAGACWQKPLPAIAVHDPKRHQSACGFFAQMTTAFTPPA
jgi:hypothetical protein